MRTVNPIVRRFVLKTSVKIGCLPLNLIAPKMQCRDRHLLYFSPSFLFFVCCFDYENQSGRKMVQLNNENVMNAIGFEKRVQNGHTVRLLGDVLPMV